MTRRRLIVGGTWPRRRALSTAEFLWRDDARETSFHTDLDPQLSTIGAVPQANADFVALAILTFLADRTIRRPTRGWEREIELDLPVFAVDDWQSLGPDVARTLEILTADSWTLNLRQRGRPKATDSQQRPNVDRVVLFSGGADSVCGAIRALANGERTLLVSHWDWAGHAGYQRALASWLEGRFPGQVTHRQHRVGRRSRQLGSAASFGEEATRRSRSILFVALGLAHASIKPSVPLWVVENGYASVNPPLAGERRGALSTRTTHPLVLQHFQQLVTSAGGHGDITNPCSTMTKGEMFAEAASTLGITAAGELLSMTHSCAHVRWAIGTGLPPDTQCGVCFGCLVRRSAFVAAGIDDQTTYLHAAIDESARPGFLVRAARQEISAIRYARRRGVTAAGLLSAGLPDNAALQDLLDVANRGLAELAAVVDEVPDLAEVI